MSARLSDLLAGIATIDPARDVIVNGLTLDSRQIKSGGVFVALQGAASHGITFAPSALARGASIVLTEAPPPAVLETHDSNIVAVDRLRERLGEIAARFFGRPSVQLKMIGVTGTNGKTSIVQLLSAALESLGVRAATIGTLGAGLVGAIKEGVRTTPDVISVQGLLAEFRDAGATHVAMEVSSHALDQGRVDAVEFDVAVFTNLTRDHLDYHGTMENYGAAKQKLFAWPDLRAAVINIDDAFGRELASGLRSGTQRITYAIESAADVRADSIRTSDEGLSFAIETPWGVGQIDSPLLGRFNVYNLLAVAGCLGALGYTFAQIQTALAQLKPVAGRMNRLGGGDAPLVVVDYAHTPDALEQALTSLRAHTGGDLICVFGAGGERDQGKRPQMGAIAEKLADRLIVTDDNPRGENGDQIVAQILAGLHQRDRARVMRDRNAAIRAAVCEARSGDVVLIAGKGHEPYQEIGGVKHVFDDAVVARDALESRPC
ncbi:MAG TPA: UDP-N-acetylmuramoyl-L-alanyl-D-glutamate--2,6-diaminopimelate ligase [Rudaea sp.]|nr:UDP-N-acetylmuramoyl-L-alanyl-D-glutamate--2,6-diaminopimelate ligase [Rudaea sp.]